MRDILVADRAIRQVHEIVFEAGFRRTPQIEHDFNDVFEVMQTDEGLPNREREDVEELGEFPTRGYGMNSYCQRSFLTSEAFAAPLSALGDHSFTTRMTRSSPSKGP